MFGAGNFAQHSILRDNIPPSELPTISKIIRVDDVTESMTSAGKPVASAIMELAQKAGYDPQTKTVNPVSIAPDSIDPDCLCFLIDNGMFKAYGEKRDQEERKSGNPKGWTGKEGQPNYDATEVEAASKAILKSFNWEQRKEQVEAKLRQDVANDSLLRENPASANIQQPVAQWSR